MTSDRRFRGSVWLFIVVQLSVAWTVVIFRVDSGLSTEQIVAHGRRIVPGLVLEACPQGVDVVAGVVPGVGVAMAGPCRVVIATTWRTPSLAEATGVLLHEAAHMRVGIDHLHDGVWLADFELLKTTSGWVG